MAGTTEGGRKTATTSKRLYGEDWYARIGAIGGRNGHNTGFALNHELARIAGAKGGHSGHMGKGRRPGSKNKTKKIEGQMGEVPARQAS